MLTQAASRALCPCSESCGKGKAYEYILKPFLKLGIPHFPLHKLRHYFASKMSALNIPEADIIRMGGWETDHVMKSVYRHSMMEKEEQAKRDATEKLCEALFSQDKNGKKI